MRLGNKTIHRYYTNRLWRGVFYVAMAIFVAQLLGLGFHRHDITEESSDCMSCYFAAHMPSGAPPVSIVAAPTLMILHYQLVVTSLYFFLTQQSYLIPLSQAPPRHIFL